MKKFELADYIIAQLRDGQSKYDKDKAITEMDKDYIFVYYRHDVYSYFYSVPPMYKNEIANELLEFFYSDNYDYNDQKLLEFKESYPEFFKKYDDEKLPDCKKEILP